LYHIISYDYYGVKSWPGGARDPGRAGQPSERNRHVHVPEHVPDRARHPGRDRRDHRAGLALGHGPGAGHLVRHLRVHGRGLQAAQAFSSARAGPVIGHLLLGLADLAAGIIALAWPGPTALVLVLIVGVRAIVAGLAEIAAAFGHGEAAGTRALFILGGLITAAFGAVLCARPGIGAVTLALLFGLFSLIAGTWTLAQGIELRHAGTTPDPAARDTTPA
jgi:Short repeat of unknown function (DUF308)